MISSAELYWQQSQLEPDIQLRAGRTPERPLRAPMPFSDEECERRWREDQEAEERYWRSVEQEKERGL